MEINLEELLDFCAYYQLNKHASQLTVETIFQADNKPASPVPKTDRVARKKVEVVPKKVDTAVKSTKPKVQVIPKRKKLMEPAYDTNIKSDKRKGNEDLTYFLNHMVGHAQDYPQKNHEQNWYNYKNYEIPPRTYGTPGEYTVKNYDTFGRSNQNPPYEIFQSKMDRQNAQLYQGSRTERYPYQTGTFSARQYKVQNQNNFVNPFEQYQPSKVKQFWQTSIYQTRKKDTDLGNMIYSPVRRQTLSPSQSLIFSQLNDRSVSKSKSKIKRKNSQRPLYNPPHIKSNDRQNETRGRKNQYDQSVLSNSFISQQMRNTNNKKQFDDEARRQTSSTIYVPKNAKEANIKKDILQNDLDDGMEEVINHIASQQRNAPIAISLVSREGKK